MFSVHSRFRCWLTQSRHDRCTLRSLGKGCDGAIFRGADDDASGVADMMEIARVFSAGARPRWSLLFAAWAGEEEALRFVCLRESSVLPACNDDSLPEPSHVGNENHSSFNPRTHTALRAVTTESAKQLGITISVQGYEGDSYLHRSRRKAYPTSSSSIGPTRSTIRRAILPIASQERIS